LRDAKFDKNSANAGQQLIDAGTFVAAVSRNPLRSLVQYVVNTLTPSPGSAPYNGCYVGTLYFDGTGGPTATYAAPPGIGRLQFNLPVAFHADAFPGDAVHFHPHGPKVYAGHHDGKRGFYVDGNGPNYNGQVTFTSSSAVDWELFRLSGATWLPVQSFPNATTCGFSITSSGYYTVDIVNFQGLVIGNIVGTVISQSSSFGHWALPYMEAKDTVLPAIRTTACSLMWSCAASALNSEGVVAGVQLKPGQSWLDAVGPGSNPVSEILKNTGGEGAAEFSLKKGIYGFHKPANEHALVETALSRSNQFGVVDTVYPLVEQDGWLVIGASTVSTGTTFPGGDGYITACWAVEFESTDPWYGAVVPSGARNSFEEAIEAIKRMPQWHENPMHFKDITKFLGNIGRTGLRLAPGFFKLLKGLAPEMAGVFEGLSLASGAGAALL